jgi:hypothetical protein
LKKNEKNFFLKKREGMHKTQRKNKKDPNKKKDKEMGIL